MGPAGIPQLEYLFSRVVCVSVPLGFTALLVILVWAGIKYLTSAGEPKAVQSAHQTVTWGLLGVVFLAIAWLILQLIQNFTGIEITKFSVASLPGVQGFTGSCFGEAPIAPEPQAASKSSTILELTCNSAGDFPFPAYICLAPCTDPKEYLTPQTKSSTLVYSSDSWQELDKVLEEPKVINVLEDSATTQLWTLKYNNSVSFIYSYESPARLAFMGGGGVLANAKTDTGNYITFNTYVEFSKDKPPKNFIEAKYEAQQVAKRISDKLGYSPFGVRDESFYGSVVLHGLSCDKYNYLVIATLSPLIYIYPSQETKVKIRINSPIISSLDYRDNSWQILVNKDGTFTENGKDHRFIPYEYLRKDFKRPAEGVVVDKNHLVSYLKNNLWEKLGLTSQEIEDYWQDLERRIPNFPFYFISLIDRGEIDRVLPIGVNPKPDTIIRNMTYILPLFSPTIPIPLSEEKLKAPERKGFTVLENGGFIDGF